MKKYVVMCVAVLIMFAAVIPATVLASDAIDATADVYQAEFSAQRPTVVSTWVGTGSHGAQDGSNAQFNQPVGVFGGEGDGIFVADTYNNLIRAVDFFGDVQKLTGQVLALDEFNFPHGFYRDGGIDVALLSRPKDGLVDDAGRIFIADSANNVIRVIAGGYVYTFAGGEGAGHVDGGYGEARFNHPSAIAIGPDGSLYVADTRNHAIRRIAPNGHVTTVAGVAGRYGHQDGGADTALFRYPMGIAVSENGTIFVADTGNHLIRVIEDGYVRTLAGSVVFPRDVFWHGAEDFDDVPIGGFADGFNARFNMPMGLAVLGDELIVADRANHRIRFVLPNGDTHTLAGTGYADHVDGLPSESAFHLPSGVFVRDGVLYIADTGNNVIRNIFLD